MSIEFRCTSCNKLLRVREEAAGRQAKCPECETVLQVPAASAPSTAPAEPPPPVQPPPVQPPPVQPPPMAAAPPPAGESENPYQSPMADQMQPPSDFAVASGQVVPTIIDTGDVFSHAWRIFKSQMGMVIAVVMIVGGINFGGSMVVNVVQGFAGTEAMVVANIAKLAVDLFFGIGQALVLLGIARGQGADFSRLIAGGRYFFPVLGAWIIVTIICILGLIALIIPGIILGLMLSQTQLLILDGKAGAIESLSLSRAVTEGNKWTIFVIGCASTGVVFLGLLACGVGLIIAAPYVMLVYVVTYLKLTGQPVAEV